jgi:hypothetical protein
VRSRYTSAPCVGYACLFNVVTHSLTSLTPSLTPFTSLHFRKHIADVRGAIEETTIEDIHRQTSQWQLNTYRQNHAPSASHMLKYYGTSSSVSTSGGGGGGGGGYASGSNALAIHDSSSSGSRRDESGDKLTSMLLGLDEDDDNGSVSAHTPTPAAPTRDLAELPYIDHPQGPETGAKARDESEEARIAAESARIIHLQVLREKVCGGGHLHAITTSHLHSFYHITLSLQH